MVMRRLRRVNSNGRSPTKLVEGVVRLDRRTKDLVGRLHPGNIAVIDHDDLDLVAAESLVERGVIAVVNVGRSITGRYPNIGPLVLARAKIPLLDEVDDGIFDQLREGLFVRVSGEDVLLNGEVIASGSLLSEDEISRRMDEARAELSSTVEAFAENTLEYVRREQHLLLDSVRLPAIKTKFNKRCALVVVRGYHYKEDLRALRGFIREMRPVIVAVDGAADACLAEGIQPDVILGDVDSVSVEALKSGAELLVHPQGDWRRRNSNGVVDGHIPEVEKLRLLGLDCSVVNAAGMSEDVAMLLAHEKGAELVVAVGTHNSAMEMLDKGRRGMASTFLVRLRLGANLVDAKGVSLLYRARVKTRDLWFLIGAAVTVLIVIGAVLPPMRLFWLGLWDQIKAAIPGLN
jgi:uncharacterized membrane-anchored protein